MARWRVVKEGAGWLLLTCSILCLLYAEIILVAATYFSFGELSTRWWLALSDAILAVVMAVLSGFVVTRSILAFRKARDAVFVKLSVVCLGIGVGEVIVAVCIYVVTLLLLSGYPQQIPTVHVR